MPPPNIPSKLKFTVRMSRRARPSDSRTCGRRRLRGPAPRASLAFSGPLFEPCKTASDLCCVPIPTPYRLSNSDQSLPAEITAQPRRCLSRAPASTAANDSHAARMLP
jgi:hypothetical protein